MGPEHLEQFKQFIKDKYNLLSERKELGDKIRLSRRQLADLEWGRV